MDARSFSCSMVNPSLPNDPPKSFTFDGVYAEDSTTEQIYNDIGFALVEVIIGFCYNSAWSWVYFSGGS